MRSLTVGGAFCLFTLYSGTALAVPVTYDYVGEPFTTTTSSGDWQVGLDHVTGRFTVELPDDFANLPLSDRSADVTSFLFKGERVGLSDPVIFQDSFGSIDQFTFSTDADGNLLAWNIRLSGFSPGTALPIALRTRSSAGDNVSFTANLAVRAASTSAPGTFTIRGGVTPGGGTTAVPSPPTASLIAFGLLSLALWRRRRA